ncbi:MAG: hypothetical protein JW395_0641 [Nitrospira sp.]|nr:hypothetical protein [Nitrospira sp.]
MPVFRVGDLVKPNPGHPNFVSEENPDALGIIIEMRDIIHRCPEAKVIWDDVPGCPDWTPVNEITVLE